MFNIKQKFLSITILDIKFVRGLMDQFYLFGLQQIYSLPKTNDDEERIIFKKSYLFQLLTQYTVTDSTLYILTGDKAQ